MFFHWENNENTNILHSEEFIIIFFKKKKKKKKISLLFLPVFTRVYYTNKIYIYFLLFNIGGRKWKKDLTYWRKI
jgi:hypothetical protein